MSNNSGMLGVLLLAMSCAARSAEPAPKDAPVQDKPAHSKLDTANPNKAKPTQPNIQFLEYLGTLEADDENWTEIAALALAAATEAPPENKPSTEPASKGEAKKQ